MAAKKGKGNVRSRVRNAPIVDTYSVASGKAPLRQAEGLRSPSSGAGAVVAFESEQCSYRVGAMEAYLRGYRDAIVNLTRRALADVAPKLEGDCAAVAGDSLGTLGPPRKRYTRRANHAAALASPCSGEKEVRADIRLPDADVQ